MRVGKSNIVSTEFCLIESMSSGTKTIDAIIFINSGPR